MVSTRQCSFTTVIYIFMHIYLCIIQHNGLLGFLAASSFVGQALFGTPPVARSVQNGLGQWILVRITIPGGLHQSFISSPSVIEFAFQFLAQEQFHGIRGTSTTTTTTGGGGAVARGGTVVVRRSGSVGGALPLGRGLCHNDDDGMIV